MIEVHEVVVSESLGIDECVSPEYVLVFWIERVSISVASGIFLFFS